MARCMGQLSPILWGAPLRRGPYVRRTRGAVGEPDKTMALSRPAATATERITIMAFMYLLQSPSVLAPGSDEAFPEGTRSQRTGALCSRPCDVSCPKRLFSGLMSGTKRLTTDRKPDSGGRSALS